MSYHEMRHAPQGHRLLTLHLQPKVVCTAAHDVMHCFIQVAKHPEAAQQQRPAVARLHGVAAHALRQLHRLQHAAGPPASAGGVPSAHIFDIWTFYAVLSMAGTSQVMSLRMQSVQRECLLSLNKLLAVLPARH